MTQSTIVAEPAIKRVSYLDPTGNVHTVERQSARRIKDIRGSVAGLLDNGNDTSSFFFTELARVLQKEYGVSKVILRTKYTSAKPADKGLFDEIAQEADFLVAGVAL